MKIEYALRIRDKGSAKINDIFHMAKLCGHTSQQMTAKWIEYKRTLPKKVPSWIHWYWRGIWDTKMSSLYRYDLEFCYIVNDIKYSIRKDSDMYYGKHDISPKQLCDNQQSSGHYWIKTGKPYFIS